MQGPQLSKISLSLGFIFLALVVAAQQEIPLAEWKEYSFAKDRFAMTFPYKPIPHADTINPGMTVYSIRLTSRAEISIRSKPSNNCDSELQNAIQSMAKASGAALPKVISVGGRKAFEDERKMGDHWSYTRLWCGDKRAFAASLGWPLSEKRPAAALRILDSFRTITPTNEP